jgi:hypothetical protein
MAKTAQKNTIPLMLFKEPLLSNGCCIAAEFPVIVQQ